jgi:hypothetical protein
VTGHFAQPSTRRVRRSGLSRNPVLLARAPKLAEQEVEPYGIEEIHVCWGWPASGATAPGGLLPWHWDCGGGGIGTALGGRGPGPRRAPRPPFTAVAQIRARRQPQARRASRDGRTPRSGRFR